MIACDLDSQDTIAAIATAPGKGGVGVIRISGPQVHTIATALLGQLPAPRKACLRNFHNASGDLIDQGLVLYFPAPHSFTGEDILEIQGHGGPLVMDMMLESILAVGARIARPGEFSQRAFLNGKMDLAQAEAVADLIDAGTRQAVLGASRSLQGVFSREVTNIGTALMQLRMRLEATIDFPDEDIDALGNALLEEKLQAVLAQLTQLQHQAQQGQLLKDGITIAIIGQPNAGKSSLLNCLTGNETAIVTPIAGTTRDIIKETIHIDGLPIHIVDTAGIRDNADLVEMEGIRRAKVQQGLADRILLVVDATATPRLSTIEQAILQEHAGKVTVVINKIDLTQDAPGGHDEGFYISAKNLTGLVPLRQHVKECAGFIGENAGLFIARRRHIFALQNTQAHCQNALAQLHEGGIDIVGEELRRAQVALGEIVGKVTADDLLGEIFSHFCIGK